MLKKTLKINMQNIKLRYISAYIGGLLNILLDKVGTWSQKG